MTRTLGERHYFCEFFREDTTDLRNIDGAWIRILTIKRDGEYIYQYRYGNEIDNMDDIDRTVCQAVLDNFNEL
ncbi:TPA: hypothetical protein U1Y64_001487 [Streptococcus suis]|uniref:hypothetical protein n=1 Tax=Streptococcus suis TaxID=1307 RepID=UPI00155689DB|nr:hypothetical protein [Streptococcus suis]WAX25047.1 hypothetical protein YS771_GM000038 [Streptococcus phage YS771]HEM4106548.1 hypothetical protein [Streptococcus suis]HEM4413734.1 hypothetical protein [Streptococcus suis]